MYRDKEYHKKYYEEHKEKIKKASMESYLRRKPMTKADLVAENARLRRELEDRLRPISDDFKERALDRAP